MIATDFYMAGDVLICRSHLIHVPGVREWLLNGDDRAADSHHRITPGLDSKWVSFESEPMSIHRYPTYLDESTSPTRVNDAKYVFP